MTSTECLICGNPTKMKRKTCSHSCGAKLFRAKNRLDPIKHQVFIDKVKKNQKRIWKNRVIIGDTRVNDKIRNTIKQQNLTLTPEQRIERYGWLNKIPDGPERDAKIDKMLVPLMALNGKEKGYSKMRKGKFRPKNPQKYKGDASNIIYRSSWELHCMMYFDRTDSILEWASEECVVNYISPSDGKPHRYYIDFYAKIKRSDGVIENLLIEVKPFKQTQPPKPRQTKTRRYVEEQMTYDKNEAKWKAARAVADKLGWKFMILTENELGLKKHK